MDCQIAKKIVDAVRLNHAHVEKPRGHRLGYMGHITIITDSLLLLLERNSTTLQPILDPFTSDEQWREYTTKIYRETKERDALVLGGQKPTSRKQDGDEMHHVDTKTDQLARFMIQQLVHEMPGQFGLKIADAELDDDAPWVYSEQQYNFDADAGSLEVCSALVLSSYLYT